MLDIFAAHDYRINNWITSNLVGDTFPEIRHKFGPKAYCTFNIRLGPVLSPTAVKIDKKRGMVFGDFADENP